MSKIETLPFMKGFNQAKIVLVKLKQAKIRMIQRQQLQNLSPILKNKHREGSIIIQEGAQLQTHYSPEILRIQKGVKRIVQHQRSKSNSRYLQSREDQIQSIKHNILSQRTQKQNAINKLGSQLQSINNQIVYYNCMFEKLTSLYQGNRQVVRQNERLRKTQVFIDCQIMKWQTSIEEKKKELKLLTEKHQQFKRKLHQQVKSYVKSSFSQQIYHTQRKNQFVQYFQNRQSRLKQQSSQIVRRYNSQQKQAKVAILKDSLDSQNAQQSDSQLESYTLNLKFNLMRGQSTNKGSLKQIPIAKKLFKDISIDQQSIVKYEQW